MSEFVIDCRKFPAFSGLDNHINKRESVCIPEKGPIPPGGYFIIDRESGGLRDLIREINPFQNSRKSWFALLGDDRRVDDFVTFCDNVVRGLFRLHPKGMWGVSQGCIVIERSADFEEISRILRPGQPTVIPGTKFKAWGKVVVR